MNKNLIAIAVFVALSSQMESVCAQEGGVTLMHFEHTVNRVQIPVNRSLQIRNKENVQQRSAHSKNKLDHNIKHSFSSSDLSTVSRSAAPKSDSLSHWSSDEEHYVITSGQNEKSDESSQRKGTGEERSGKSREEHKADRDRRREEREARRSLKHYVGIRHGKRSDTQTETTNVAGPGSGNQGIGDGTNVSLNNGPAINDLSQANNVKTINLKHGDAFIAHNKPVQINTERGQIRIAPHAAVYVVAEGKSLAVYNIADNKSKDVSIISSGKKLILVPAGEQVVVSDKDNKEFEKANPVPEIEAKRTHELGEDMENRIFDAEFSPIAALDHAKGFQELLNSKNEEDKKLAEHILKTAAVVLSLRGSSN